MSPSPSASNRSIFSGLASFRVFLMGILVVTVTLMGCGEAPGADPADSGGGGGAGGHQDPADGAAGGGDAAGNGGGPGAAGGAGSAGAAGVAGSGGVAGGAGGASASGGGGDGSAGASASGGRGGLGGRAGAGGSAGMAGRGGAGAGGSAAGTTGRAGASATGGTGGTGASGGTTGTAGGAALPLVTLYLASDSTVSNYDANHRPQAGWGQMLPEYLTARAKVDNRAVGGRSSRRFISEGRLDAILAVIKPDDYLFVQFGTNDGNQTALYDDGTPYYVSPADFEMYMEQYISGARGKKAIPVLVTPPPRRSCDTANDARPFGNGTGGYATAMKNVAARTGAALIDVNKATLDYLNSIGCAASAQVFLVVPAGQYTGAYANGVSDGTHFQEFGARKLAGFVADGIRTLALPLAAYLK